MNRTGIKPEIRELAESLIAFEAGSHTISKADRLATCRVCEKLRRPLVTLTGTAGFSSLLARSLTLAKRESPALTAVQVKPDGSIDGLEGDAAEAQTILVAHLLGLLITFIGDTLTMRLLHDVWPNLPGPGLNPPGKESK